MREKETEEKRNQRKDKVMEEGNRYALVERVESSVDETINTKTWCIMSFCFYFMKDTVERILFVSKYENYNLLFDDVN